MKSKAGHLQAYEKTEYDSTILAILLAVIRTRHCLLCFDDAVVSWFALRFRIIPAPLFEIISTTCFARKGAKEVLRWLMKSQIQTLRRTLVAADLKGSHLEWLIDEGDDSGSGLRRAALAVDCGSNQTRAAGSG